MGSAQPAPRAVGSLQRHGAARPAHARLPDLQLDRARRVALHRARADGPARDLLLAPPRGLRTRWHAPRGLAVRPTDERRASDRSGRPLPHGRRHDLHRSCPLPREVRARRHRGGRRERDQPARRVAGRRKVLRRRDGGSEARGLLLMSVTTADLLYLATIGSVDDGKSTLIGRLLIDTRSIYRDQLGAVERASRQRGDAYTDIALITDGLRAEREQGITIDVAYRYFNTPRRKFVLIDCPGHPQYTRNMVTGASKADLVVILVDARQGLTDQARRHATIASLLRVPHAVVCVNKMDLVDWSQDVFERCRRQFSDFASRLSIQDIVFIPTSALKGDNVVSASKNMPWYAGATILYQLENVHHASDRDLIDVRFPVQYVIRPRSDALHDYRAYAGRVARGGLKPTH